MTSAQPIRIGTRASPLARWQAQWVSDALTAAGHSTLLVPISTRGDFQQFQPVEQLGDRGVFTKELQRALLAGEIDVAVHSLKDLPTEPVAALILTAVPRRESPCDVLVSRNGLLLETLPPGARVGTGSLRRQSQLLHRRPDMVVAPIRGNVDTRLHKLDEGQYDALILAQAGLHRLELSHRVTQVLPTNQMLPAVGQGALGLEARAEDQAIRAALAALDDPASHMAVVAERSLLESLDGGCLAPIGALATVVSHNGRMRLEGVVLSRDGVNRLHGSVEGEVAEAIELGRRLAGLLLEQGAAALIRAARHGVEL